MQGKRREVRRSALQRNTALSLVFITSSLLTLEAQAAGFFIQEQEARGIGRANAGAAAIGDDPATVFWNPAGMTNLNSAAADASLTVLLPDIDVRDKGTTAATPGSAGVPVPVGGGDGGNPLGPALIPNLHAAYPLLEKRLWVGLGITAPFGLTPEYNESWFGRYESTETALRVINVGPTVAYKVNDFLSIGGGVDIQYADAKLKSHLPDPLNPGGPTPATDARFRADGDGFAVGFNAGVTLTPVKGTRLGLHYRSAITNELDGRVDISGLTGPLAASNGKTDMTADLKLPDIVGFGIAQNITPELTLLGQVNWFNWSRYDEVRLQLSNGQPDLVSAQNYRDSWSLALGAEYRLDPVWTLRAGFQFDQTPTRDAESFSTRVPDGNRYYVTAGATYQWSDALSIDAAVGHVFLSDNKINRTDTVFAGTPVASTVNTVGTTGGYFDIVAVKATLKF